MLSESTSDPTAAKNSGLSSDVRRVLIVKSNLESFRVPFFSGLVKRLARQGVELRVAVSANRCTAYTEDWLLPIEGGEINVLGKKIFWQGIDESAKRSELIIVQQTARELSNYPLMWFRKKYGYKLALWGHGTEFQRTVTSPLAHFIKSRVFGKVDFWFAYTPGVAKLVEDRGYPHDRICTTYNSVDTASEVAFHKSVTEKDKQALRAELGMQPGAKLVCYCGSLYKAKRLDFLLDACKAIRTKGLDLHLAVIGGGSEGAYLESLRGDHQWLHLPGSLHGKQKALYLAASEYLLIPGVVGLAVVDAFAHECPLITTSIPGHGPEIEYLVNGVNGVIAENEIDDYVRCLERALTDEEFGSRLRQGCRGAAADITIENMIEHFATGVLAALRMPKLAE
jgi:glycosyltransferase involved in cell wall biosynthesis